MSTITRYIVGSYLRMFLVCLLAGVGLLLTVEFFDRIGDFATYDSGAQPVLLYFALKIPKMLTEVFPVAALTAVLLSIGLLVKNNEVTALRACGYDANRLAVPLLITSVVLSGAALAWSETVVPPTASRARSVKDNDIKQLRERGLFNAKSLWYQDPRGFLSIDLYDAVNKVLYGVKLHEMDDAFRLARTLEFAEIAWNESGWQASNGTEYTRADDGTPIVRPVEGGDFELTGTPSDFRQKQRRSDEYSYVDLAHHIELLEARGLDTNEFRVDLHAKLAIPFAGLVTVFVGFPLAIRGGKRFGLVYRTSLGIVVSFVYWAMLGMCVAAGHAGKLPPVVAAWSANFVFAAIGAALFTRADA